MPRLGNTIIIVHNIAIDCLASGVLRYNYASSLQLNCFILYNEFVIESLLFTKCCVPETRMTLI